MFRQILQIDILYDTIVIDPASGARVSIDQAGRPEFGTV